jgi:glucan-binding YG repeat protein
MGYRLVGHQYQEIPLTSTNKRWSEELELYLGVEQGKLRYFTPEGELIPTPQEAALQEIAIAESAQQLSQQAQQMAEQEKLRADQAQQQAEQEKHRADTLASYLRSLGINPEEIG